MKIIVINGQGRVGKDTFVNYCIEETPYVHNISTITPVKMLAKIVGWGGQKTDKDRKLLSDLKNITTEYNDWSYQKTLKAIEDLKWDYHYFSLPEKEMIIFLHCREPEEITRWENEHGARSLLIRRRAVEKDYDNSADGRVFNKHYDYVIDNDGSLLDFKRKATDFINEITKEDWKSKVNFIKE